MRGLLLFVGDGYVGGVSGVGRDGESSDFFLQHFQDIRKDFIIFPCSGTCIIRHVLVGGFPPQHSDLVLQLNDLRLQRNDLQLQSIKRSCCCVDKLAR